MNPTPSNVSDDSLSAFLSLSEAEAAIIIPKLKPKERALYARMMDVCADLNMGVVPDGVIVCRERGYRHG